MTKSLLSTRYQLTSEAGLDAPLEAGQAVGVVQEYYGSICVGQTDLVTVTGVERNAFGAVVMQVKGEIAQSPGNSSPLCWRYCWAFFSCS
ncbi:MAG: hypothetical protein ACLSHU_05420 [Oscillospiraceae bacterium]